MWKKFPSVAKFNLGLCKSNIADTCWTCKLNKILATLNLMAKLPLTFIRV